MTYLEWNNKIAKYFFNPDKSGIRVWFSVKRELIEKIAQENNTDFEDFIRAVKQGPDWVTRNQQKVCIKARDAFKDWKQKGLEYPPYIAYLALFVLAVNHGDSEDFSENAYYGRLRDMLNENPSTGQYPSFEKMPELWDDLAIWSSKVKEGLWGEFYHDIYGKHFHVGIPRYQVVLTTTDRNNLSEIFWKAGWNADSNPTEEEIIQTLKNNQNSLSQRTSRRVRKGNSDFLSVLVDRILEELTEYNEETSVEKSEESEKRGIIALCLKIDETAEQINISFRCRRKSGLPEEEFTLENQNIEWRVPFFRTNISDKIQNCNIDWEKNLSVKSGKYSFCYVGQKYKVFTPAKDVSDWISGQRYIAGKLFYLAVHQSLFDKVKKWGSKECDQCSVLQYSGLPKNWHLFKIKGVNKDSIKADIPVLSIDQKPRIKFEGGIRLSKGNRFFSFAPPKIVITGGTEKISKLFYSTDNSTEYKELVLTNQNENFFYLPEDTPYEERITVSYTQSKQEEGKKIFLTENQLKKISHYSDESIPPDNAIFRSRENYHRFPDILWNPRQKAYLVGEVPGQITDKPFSNLWLPIWLIQFKNHKKVIATWLGNRFSYTEKLPTFSKEKIQLWKDIIWHRRKRIKSKTQKKWKKFSDRAKNV